MIFVQEAKFPSFAAIRSSLEHDAGAEISCCLDSPAGSLCLAPQPLKALIPAGPPVLFKTCVSE